jgi:hypothetical protein
MPYSRPALRYRTSCEECMFLAEAANRWSLSEELNLHVTRCNPDPIIVLVA